MRSYRMFIRSLAIELQDAIIEAEDLGWHHEDVDSPVGIHYNRLLTWYQEASERVMHYDAKKIERAWKRLSRPTTSEASGGMVRLDNRRIDGLERANASESLNAGSVRRTEGDDGSPNPD